MVSKAADRSRRQRALNMHGPRLSAMRDEVSYSIAPYKALLHLHLHLHVGFAALACMMRYIVRKYIDPAICQSSRSMADPKFPNTEVSAQLDFGD